MRRAIARRAVDRTAAGSRRVANIVVRGATAAVAVVVAPGLLLAWPGGPALAEPAPPLPPGAWHAAEHFHLTSADASSNRQHVRATGPFTGRGYALAGDFASGHAVSRLVFRRGALRLVTKARHRSVSVPNASTCKFTEVFKGEYVIRGGTGRYRHARGSGTYVSRISGKLKKTRGGRCGDQLASFWQSTKTRGTLHR